MTSSDRVGWRALPVRRLDCPPPYLDLASTLDCGQSFRWRLADDAWVGIIGDHVYRLWLAGQLYFQVWPDRDDPTAELAAYLRLDVDVAAMGRELALADGRIAQAIVAFPGLRVLGQPPIETLLTFACSPASNIIRITRSIDLLGRRYGRLIGTIDGRDYFAFPTVEALAGTEPGELAATTGLGFRGPTLRALAAELLHRPVGWVESLCDVRYDDARQALVTLPAIGPKIADCVCLFGLRHDEAVPVDTHVWALAHELFGDEIGTRTLTPATYAVVLHAFRRRYGRWAGWAQQYLFHARRVGRELPMPSRVTLIRA